MESRRNVELGLLLLALILSVGAYVIVGLVATNQVPAGSAGYGFTLAVLFIGAHLVLRWKAPQADPLLLPGAALLNGLGLVMVRRLDYAMLADDPDRAAQAPAQALWTVLGVAVFVAVILVISNQRALDDYPYTWLLVGLGLLALPALPVIGQTINGARLWVEIGPISGQPAEAAKIALVVFLAAYLAQKRELLANATYRVGPFLLPEIKYFLPMLLAWAVSLFVLVYERDLGSSLLFFGVFVALLYAATGRASYVVAGLGLFAMGALLANALFGHVQQRVQIWLDPWPFYDDKGYQLIQGLFALANGGVLGEGWNQGRPDLIPFASTDFIFAAFGEEVGLVGVTAMLLVYLMMVFRGLRIALASSDDFSKLLALGLTTSFGLQVFVIVGGVTRIIPLTGITLPFVSFGGSSLLANYALIALLCRISATATAAPARAGEPEPEQAPPPPRAGEVTVIR